MTAQRFSFRAMASPCEVAIAGLDEGAASRAAQAAQAEVRRVEAKYSRFLDDSVTGRINAGASAAAVPIDEETAALLAYAEQLHRISNGLFDLTTGALQAAWDFRLGVVPDEATLARALSVVGWDHVSLSDLGVRFNKPGVRIDFGGFGKEYAADRAASLLEQQGVRSGYVNLGGDIRVVGPKPDGTAWRFGVRHPRREDELLSSIPLSSGALATSGDYERYFEREGKRYCHLLSPHSGLPATWWQSVSVIAPQAITAGATSTIAMLMQEAGLEFLRASALPYLAVDHTGAIHTHQSHA